MIVFFFTVTVTQILLVLKKKQFEKVQAAEMNFYIASDNVKLFLIERKTIKKKELDFLKSSSFFMNE
jgi:hypothetical protein